MSRSAFPLAFGVLLVCTLPACGEDDPASVPGGAGASAAGGSGAIANGGSAGSLGLGGSETAGGAGSGGLGTEVTIPTSFAWSSSGALVSPIPNATHPIVSVKDPSIVYYGDRYHVFATTANTSANWSLVYLNFSNWEEAAQAVPFYLDQNPALVGYHAAPHVFFFEPQNKWYMIFQSGQPQYSTTDDITRPESWTVPVNFFAGEPPGVTANKGEGFWLDFFIICDATDCYLFFTDDDGEFFRSRTSIGNFPSGFDDPVVAIQGTKETLFEAGATYSVEGSNRYLTLIEAFGPTGNRFYRSFVADTLGGEWTPLADTWEKPFAGINNVTFENGSEWTRDISHGELLRKGYDQNMVISLDGLQFLYQGVGPAQTNVEYSQLPYRLGLLTRTPAALP